MPWFVIITNFCSVATTPQPISDTKTMSPNASWEEICTIACHHLALPTSRAEVRVKCNKIIKK